MEIDERIIKYIENEMTSEERISFETDLNNSSQLREDLENYLKVEQLIEESKRVKLNQLYLNSILPEFRNDIYRPKSFTIQKKISYAFGIVLIIVLSLVIFNNNFNEYIKSNSVKEFTQSLNYNQKIELLENLNSDSDDFNLIIENSADIELTNFLQSSLIVNNEVADVYDISYTDLVEDLSQMEADNIYNEILNKKFF